MSFNMIIISSIILLSIIWAGIIFKGKSGTVLDVKIKDYFLKRNDSTFVQVMAKITKLANIETLFIIIVPILFYLIQVKAFVMATSIMVSFILSVVSVHTLKFVFQRHRPIRIKSVNHIGYSFPSGHSCVGMCFYLTLCYLLSYGHKFFYPLIILAFIFGLLIGMSRIALGVHWFSDVIAGLILGLICAYWSIHLFNIGYYFNFIF